MNSLPPSSYKFILDPIHQIPNTVEFPFYRSVRGKLIGSSASVFFLEGSPYRIDEDLK